jgi:UDP-GlcNAc:undecaprenyl-phosphate GlcNAc-1-phosphate transferase
LLIYGLDAATTILFRIIRKENIFKAHRSHFYQFLANEKKIPHLVVSASYIFVQGIVNVIVIFILSNTFASLSLFVVTVTFIFILLRLFFEGSQRLLSTTQ